MIQERGPVRGNVEEPTAMPQTTSYRTGLLQNTDDVRRKGDTRNPLLTQWLKNRKQLESFIVIHLEIGHILSCNIKAAKRLRR